MYLIKELQLLTTTTINGNLNFIRGSLPLYAINGLKVGYSKACGPMLLSNYWGSHTVVCDCNDPHFEKTDDDFLLLSYANSYGAKDEGDGFKHIWLYSKKYEEKIDGYIIFMEVTPNCVSIKTKAEILFQRYGHEIVCVLREGDELTVADKKVQVINGQLIVNI